MNAMTKRDRILQLAIQINAAHEQLRKLEDEFAQLVPDEEEGVVVHASSNGDNHDLGPATDRIVGLLKVHPNQQFHARDVAKRLDLKNFNSLRGTLQRLANEKRIDRAGRGKYRARKDLGTVLVRG
jgi:hypothetical protein